MSDYFLDHQHRLETRNRRFRTIFVSLFVVLIAVITCGSAFYLLFLSDFFRSDNTAAGGTATEFTGFTTKQAYELALISAQEWREDASLLKATATWTQGSDRESFLSGSETWSFSFYSPGSKRAANISVIDGKATMINQQSLGSSIQPSPIDDWTIDSNIAILRMLNEGGEEFLNENQINSLTMALTAGVQRGRPEWLISLFSAGGGKYYNMRLDASNGEVLDTFNSS